MSAKDINGSPYTYVVYDTQPTGFSNETNNFQNYWMTTGVLANYIGYGNLSLYAVYASEEKEEAEPVDYTIETNLDIAASADGTPLTISGDAFTVPNGSSSVVVSYSYKSGVEFEYDSVELKVIDSTRGEIASPKPEGTSFTFPPSALGLSSGSTCTLTLNVTKSGSDDTYAMTMTLE